MVTALILALQRAARVVHIMSDFRARRESTFTAKRRQGNVRWTNGSTPAAWSSRGAGASERVRRSTFDVRPLAARHSPRPSPRRGDAERLTMATAAGYFFGVSGLGSSGLEGAGLGGT